MPCLYRHKLNDTYYAAKKTGRKRKEHSLDTTDRKIAERKLKKWIAELDKVDRNAAKTTLEALLQKFAAINSGKANKTQATNRSIVKRLETTWKQGLAMPIAEIKPSHLNEWLAQQEARLKNTSYNRYAGFLKQLFEIAVQDRIIAHSPFEGVKTKWKKPQKTIRNVPTQDQFQAAARFVWPSA